MIFQTGLSAHECRYCVQKRSQYGLSRFGLGAFAGRFQIGGETSVRIWWVSLLSTRAPGLCDVRLKSTTVTGVSSTLIDGEV